MTHTRLPLELYREIMQYLSHEQLAPLLICSRILRAEASRVIFKNVYLIDADAITSFHDICNTAGAYVQHLYIYIEETRIPGILLILESVPSLEELKIRWRYPEIGLEDFLPRHPIFRLRTLITNHSHCPELTRFIESQRGGLKHLQFQHDSDPNLSLKFPQLCVFSAQSVADTQDILECGTVRCLGSVLTGELHQEFPSVRAVKDVTFLSAPVQRNIALFPNLRYLQGQLERGSLEGFPNHFPALPNIEKLRVGIRVGRVRATDQPPPSQEQLSPLFQNCPKLLFVCLSLVPDHGAYLAISWVYARGTSAPTRTAEDRRAGDSEWLRYQDENYVTTA